MTIIKKCISSSCKILKSVVYYIFKARNILHWQLLSTFANVEGKKSPLDGYRERVIFFIRVHTRQRDIPRSYWSYQKREQISFLVFSCAEKMLLMLDKIRIAIKIYPDRFFASSSPWKYDASSSIKHTGIQHTRINAL